VDLVSQQTLVSGNILVEVSVTLNTLSASEEYLQRSSTVRRPHHADVKEHVSHWPTITVST